MEQEKHDDGMSDHKLDLSINDFSPPKTTKRILQELALKFKKQISANIKQA